MAFATEFHMPGSYGFEAATPLGQPLSATVFRPPMSPSASSSVYNLAKSTGSLYSDVSMANTPGIGAKRKRTRADASRASTPNADWNLNMDGAGEVREEGRPSARLAASEIRYTLAGQIETPSGAHAGMENGILGLEDSAYSDIDYRRALGSRRDRDDLESPSIQFSGLRLQTPLPVTPQPVGWSKLAFSTIGGVVGKVWEFCKTGGFRGFQAGGGEGYGLYTPTKPGASHDGQPWCNEHDIPTLETEDSSPTPLNEHIPGGFPKSEYVSLHELSTLESTRRPAVKRRQTSATNGDELRRNWVMVSEPSPSAPTPTHQPTNTRPASAASFTTSGRTSTTSARPSMTRSGAHQPRYSTPTTSSGSRRISVPVSRLGTTPSAAPRTRTSLRISHAGSPALSTRQPASYAAPRSPHHDYPSSPSRIPLPANPAIGAAPNPFAIPGTTTTTTTTTSLSRPESRQRQQQRSLSRCASPAPLKAPGHKRSVSNASASSARLKVALPQDGVGVRDSPRLSAEAKELAAKKMAAERDADAKMEAFNRRLMDMIRQGKEALGTTVEVEMEFGAPTAGWEDDE